MPKVIVNCQLCAARLSVESSLFDRTVKCPKCGEQVPVPTAAAAPPLPFPPGAKPPVAQPTAKPPVAQPVAAIPVVPPPQPKKSGGSKWLLPVLAVAVLGFLVVAGGVAGAIVYFSGKAEPEVVEQPPPAPEPPKPEPAPAEVTEPVAERQSLPPEHLFKAVLRGTVLVFADPGKPEMRYGLGWLAHADKNVVVTSNRIVDRGQQLVVVFPAFGENGELIVDSQHYLARVKDVAVPAQLLDRKESADLAALELQPSGNLKVPATARALPLSKDGAKVGERVFVPDISGFDRGVAWKQAEGLAQGRYRGQKLTFKSGHAVEAELVETQTPFDRADRGGPMVNDRGELVGTVFFSDDSKLNLGIDVIEVRRYLQDVFRKSQWTWNDTQAAPYVPRSRLPALRQKLAAASEPREKVAALRQIGAMDSDAVDAVTDLLPLLEDADEDVRKQALTTLMAIGTVSNLDTRKLTKPLQSDKLEAKTYAAWAYCRVEAPNDAVASLVRMLTPVTPQTAELRRYALKAIGRCANASQTTAFRPVMDRLDDPDKGVANEAATALVTKFSLTKKDLDDLKVKLHATSPAAAAGGGEYRPNPEYGRELAAEVLSMVDTKKVPASWTKEVFRPVLKDRNENVRLSAVKALRAWGREAEDCLLADANKPGLMDLLLPRETREPFKVNRKELAESLGVIGSRAKGVLDVLVELWQDDPDQDVRDAALQSLLQVLENTIPQESDIPTLRTLLRNPKCPSDFKAKAAALLTRMIETAADKEKTRLAVAAAAPELAAAVHQTNSPDGIDDRLQFEALKTLAEVGEVLFTAKLDTPRTADDVIATVAEVLLPQTKADVLNRPAGGPAGQGMTDRLARSTVWVVTDRGSGSGMVVRGGANPLIVTNHHVVAGATSGVRVFFADYGPDKSVIGDPDHYLANAQRLAAARQYQIGRVVVSSPVQDLAVLVLPQRLPDRSGVTRLADASAKQGSNLHLLGMSGASSGSLWRYSDGKVRALLPTMSIRYSSGQTVACRGIETTMPINKGDSGAGIVNDAGELVAVNCAFDGTSRSVSNAIDVAEVRDVLARAAQRGGTATSGGRLENSPEAPALPAYNVAPGDVQNAAIKALRSFKGRAIAPLAKALDKKPGAEQMARICTTLADLGGSADEPTRKEVVRVSLVYMFRAVEDIPEVRDAASTALARIGGDILARELLKRTERTYEGDVRRPIKPELRLWAVRTLGRFDPASLSRTPKVKKDPAEVGTFDAVQKQMKFLAVQAEGDLKREAIEAEKNLDLPGVK